MGLLARTRAALFRKNDYRMVFQGSDAGKRVLADIYRFAGLDRQMHVPGDPFGTTFNDGMRRVALRIAKLLNEDDNKVIQRLEGEDSYGVQAEDHNHL